MRNASARRLLGRAAVEARYAATLLQARGPGIALIPPHRLAGIVRDVAVYGPAGAALSIASAGQADATAIVDERGALTFGELERRSNALANALRSRGWKAGDNIGVLARNHRGMFETIFAAARLGAPTLLLNTDFAGPQLVDVCERERVAVLVHDEEFDPVVGGYSPPLGRVLSWTGAADNDGPRGAATIDELVAGAQSTPPPRPARKQRIVLLTSGTTGTPKGAPRDISLSLAIPGGYLSKIPLRSGRTVLLAAPAFHAWGLLSSVVALGLGNTLILERRFDARHTLAALERHRVDALITVPVLLARLLALGDDVIRGHDLRALRIVAVSGSALAPVLARHAMDVFGDVLYNLYGSTEVAYATIATPADLRAAPGTVGRPPFGTSVRLLDADGHDVLPGQVGRIFVGSSIQFEGYTGGGSKEIVRGLMSTGDVGHFDRNGLLFVEGRDDDMIVSGGENVFPREIEELLVGHPLIGDAAVIGVDDPEFGSRLRAYVVRGNPADQVEHGRNGEHGRHRECGELDEEAVRDYVRANLARFKVPREVVFIDELPRNPAGKIVKRLLPDPA